jgi:hypothetical protein
MSRVRSVTIALALLAGAAAAWLAVPAWTARRALDAIASADAEARRAGWDWLLAPSGDAPPRAAGRLDDVNARLADAPDDAVLHGADRLHTIRLWGWAHQPRGLVLRVAALHAAGTPDAQGLAAETLAAAPLDLDPEPVAHVAGRLLGSSDPAVRDAAFAAACGWAGRDADEWIDLLPVRADDRRTLRVRHLALARTRPPCPGPPIDPGSDADVLAAALVRAVVGRPDDTGPLLDLLASDGLADAAPLEYALRYADDRRAVPALERRADGGSAVARFALQARARHMEDAAARRVLGDPERPRAARRLAAWRWDRVPPGDVRALLEEGVADDDGSVHAAVLLAERRLPADEATALAETWIRSFDDDEKRAGALLAALLGAHADRLERAYEAEDVEAVRTTQRLALWAAGRPTGPDDPIEFAHRTLHLPDDGGLPDFRGDTALCMLVAGRHEALPLLTSPPRPIGASVRTRAWLIERFVPGWHETVGRPIGGDAGVLRLHFDALEALRLLTARRLAFDPARRTFAERPRASRPASPPAPDR